MDKILVATSAWEHICELGASGKKKNDCDWLFSQEGVIVRVSVQSVLLEVLLPAWTINRKTALKWSLKKLSSVSHRIAVVNTACLEANLSFAGNNWPTNNNQATLFPLEASNGLQMELMQTNDVTHNQLNHNKDPEA